MYIPTERSTITRKPTTIIIKLSSTSAGNSNENPLESPLLDCWVTKVISTIALLTISLLLFLKIMSNSTTPSYPLNLVSELLNLDKYSSYPGSEQVSQSG